MGGRGTALAVVASAPIETVTLIEEAEPALSRDGDKPYELQGRGDFPSGRTYALLEATGRDWRIITRPADEYDLLAEDPADRFGMDTPTLSWAKDGNAVQIYVDGMSTEDFLHHLGLEIDLKNTTTTSKRLSRLFRPQAATAWFEADEVSISYDLSQPKFQRVPDPDNLGETLVQWGTGSGSELPAEVVEKVWDGAGVVSRGMLLKMIEQLPPDMEPRLRAKTVRELRNTQRVEFTLMTEQGQLKGHAMVGESLSTDFVIPEDLKTQVRLTDPGQRYVAFEFPHGHDHMRLDIQSAVNLTPFWEGEQLVQWLKEDYQVFEQSVRTGDIAAGMAKIDRNTTIEDLQQWALREYAASGGDINWSGSFVKSYLNSYINRVGTLTDPDSKLKLPIPGGRYYVMPSMVGRRANLPVQVARGEVFIDPDTQTAWVNDQDWIELQDGASYGRSDMPMNERWGIAKILGGADHDDALWVHPFTDHDGERKMLLWRSPNEAGERVILKPSPESAALSWQTVDGEVVYPGADSRKLPERADRIQVEDRGLIDLNPKVNDVPTGAAQPVLHEVMRKAAEREAINAALLGSVCNYQMVYKAVHGTHPPERPAPLEEVIDLKKTGADGRAVANWVWDKRKGLLDSGTPIPRLLAERVSTRVQQAVTTDGSHWLDRIEDAVNAHVARVREVRDELVAQTRPPQALFDYALQRPDLVGAGSRLNQKYAGALAAIRQQIRDEKREMTVDDWERARQVAIMELNKTPPQARGRVLIGTIASVYMSKDPGNDGVAWLMGPKNEQGLREAGFAQQTMAEMRKIGILSDLIPDPSGKGLIQYQAPRPQADTSSQTIGINGVWRNFFDIMAGQAKLPNFDDWDTSTKAGKQSRKAFAKRATQKVADYMGQVGAVELEVREEDWKDSKRKVVYSARSGQKFGTIDKVDEDRYVVGQRLTITGSLVKDGNLRAIAQFTP